MTPRPIIVVTSAAFRPERKAALDRLLAELRPQCSAVGVPLLVHEDREAKGSLGPWLHVLAEGAAWPDVTHVTYLPDDAILVPHFIEVLLACIEAQPEAILCFQSNHEGSRIAAVDGARWYTTPDGFTAFGGTMPVQWVREHLAWRKTALRDDRTVQGDEGVNAWAMCTGRRIFKSLPSLVDHDLTIPSADGNDHHAELSPRRPLVWDPEADLRRVDWGGPVVHLGPTYTDGVWQSVWRVRPEAWELERTYEADRGTPVSQTPHVLIATPAYSGPELGYLRSVNATISDLQAHGIKVSHVLTSGDSLVTRGRHHLAHDFLRTEATHFLQWDADVECEDPGAVRKMLETGHPIIGGAYPWRDGSGRVVCNPLQGPGVHTVTIANDCIEVAEVGTGFLLVHRPVLVDLMKRHPELLYESDFPNCFGHPIWALFDSHLEMTATGRRRYASEDWRFCSLARDAGYRTHVYLPPVFKHWGKKGHEGHITRAWKMSGLEAGR